MENRSSGNPGRSGSKSLFLISNQIEIKNPPADFFREIKARLTIQNPAWLENERMERWNASTPELFRFYQDTPTGLLIPRGFISQVVGIARRAEIAYQIEDRRRTLHPVDFTFTGKLRPFQEEAVRVLLARDFGTLAAPTGSGKTVIACAMIAQRRQPALIIVHTKELADQWGERIGQFLGIPPKEIGRIGDGKRVIGEKITVALVQSLYKCAAEINSRVGYLIVDECHRTPSRTFSEAVSAFDCKYMTGLSATPWRRDGLSRLIFWHVGDVIHEIKKRGLIEGGDLVPLDVVWRETNFHPEADPTEEYSSMLTELTLDATRNVLITGDVIKEVRNGGGVGLILSDRKSHCECLHGLLSSLGIRARLLTGDLRNGERRQVVEDLNVGRVKVLVATGQLIGEGFDCKTLSTLFLATPIKFDGRVLQYLGRVLRPPERTGRNYTIMWIPWGSLNLRQPRGGESMNEINPSINLNSIPEDLKSIPNWVAWKLEIRDGKPTKIPMNPKTGGNAQSDRPETWTSYQEAVNFCSERKGNVEGIGFEFLYSPYCGIDLDKCRDTESGKVEPWATEIVAKINSYTEVSPSGKGLHIIVRGTLPPVRKRKGQIEMYDTGRYFTVTGHHFPGTPATIEAREKELKALHARIFSRSDQNPAPATQPRAALTLSDSDLIEKARRAGNGEKFSLLWAGEWNAHPSQSEADLALCSMLAFWTGQDPRQMDRLFRQSALMREKWDERRGEKTYGEMTIQKAIEQTSDTNLTSNIE